MRGPAIGIAVIFLSSCLVCSRMSAETADATATRAALPLATRIDGLLKQMVRNDGFSGTVLIARRGQLILDKGYGLANRASRAPNRTGTKYRIFDVTEQFTAMAILELQERGNLTTSDRVCTYISGCPVGWESITVQELLTHTSGIPSFTSFPGYRLSQLERPQQIVDRAEGRKLDFLPGNTFEFSQTNYILLGLIIEKASGERYESFMRDNVFAPLRMMHTGFMQDGLSVSKLAAGYQGSKSAPSVDASTPWADGGMYSTASDLYRWDQCLSTEKLVSKQSLLAMFTPYIAVPPETRIGYGYGWLIGPLFDHQADFHGGNAGGFQALNMRFPNAGLTIIILSNQGYTDTGAMYGSLVPILFGK